MLALTLSGAPHASSWDLAPGLLLIGTGAGGSIGQLFWSILTNVTMDQVGSASGAVEAMQQPRSRSGSRSWASSSSLPVCLLAVQSGVHDEVSAVQPVRWP